MRLQHTPSNMKPCVWSLGPGAQETDAVVTTAMVTDSTNSTIQEPTVKRTLSTVLITLAGIAAVGAARTADAQSVNSAPLTRAQVVAELQRARASGELARETDELYGSQPAQTYPSTTTRAQVKAELKQAIDSGELKRETDELYGAFEPAPVHSTRSTLTRAQVHAEVLAAQKSGELARVNEDETYPSDHPI